MPRDEPAPSRNKKPPGLKFEVPKAADEHNQKEDSIPEVSIDLWEREFHKLDCTDMQRGRMEEFFTTKRAIGELKQDDLVNICELGQGNGGVVWKVRHKSAHIIMARKLIYLEVKPAQKNQIIRELKILHQCNSPYIVGFYGAFAIESQISICMEYMDAGSLDLILKKVMRVPENIAGRITVAVLRGLTYLRERQSIMHRDIKPSNILLNHKGEIKLCDFGVSRQLNDSMIDTFIGTRSYMSPERLEGTHYGIKSDIWSLGLSLVEIAVGGYPIPPPSTEDIDRLFKEDPHGTRPRPEGYGCYKGLAVFELMEWIVNESPPTLPRTHFSPEFCDFIDRCLKKNTLERTDLSTLFRHEFYKRYESDSDNQDVPTWLRQVCRTDSDVPTDSNQRRSGT